MRVRRLADELEIPVAHAPARIGVGDRGEPRASRRAPAGAARAARTREPVAGRRAHDAVSTRRDLETLAACGAAVVHCPESNLKLGSGVCPAVGPARSRRARGAWAPTARPSNNDLDLLSARCARRDCWRPVSAPRPVRSCARDLLRMATLEGARALGLGDSIGSLVAGQVGRPVLRRPARCRAPGPCTTCAADARLRGSSRQVTDTWVAGRHVFADGALRYIDEDCRARSRRGLARSHRCGADGSDAMPHDA